MPASTGVRQSTVYWPGAVSLISRYAGRDSWARAAGSPASSDEQRRRDVSGDAAHADHFDTAPDGAGPFVTCEDDGAAAARRAAPGSSTVYLARMSLYAFSQASAFCSPSHAVLTSASISSKAGTRPGITVSTNTRCQPKPDSMGPCHDPGGSLATASANCGPNSLPR